MSVLTKIFGDPNERVLKGMQPIVEDINVLEKKYEKLSDPEIREVSLGLRDRVRAGEATLDQVLPEAFALCREAAKRTLGQRHFDVQLMGGIALHRGQIAEMRTGEGKTLTSTLAVYLNGLEGKGVHVVTVNDYLSRRDAAWMGQVYHALGLTTACINHMTAFVYDPTWQVPENTAELTVGDLAAASAKEEGGETDRERDETGSFKVQNDFLRPVERRDAYAADITYGTNNEFGFDYLRDNMVMHPDQRSQRPLNYAIIDEVDSILIDEARTPLIISAPAEEAADSYYRFAEMVGKLVVDEDYNIDEKMHAVSLTEAGISKLEGMLNVGNIYEEAGVTTVHHIESALKARELYRRDRNYVVRDGEVIIVDEFTGRLMHGRRYSEGLHQAIEAKEGVKIQRESRTLATITFQNYFRMYAKLAGMTGTAATEAEEFSKIYDMDVTVIPTNRDPKRTDLPDLVYRTVNGKYQAVVREIRDRHETGQPVLVGTISIEQNEILGELLRREGVPFKLLNAKNHEGEGETIAQAGRLGAVTVATNMAGRGVDIKLGGNPPVPGDAERVRNLGGLMVIGTERHESRRIDNQLRGRCGRQGDPGLTRFFLSVEDDLMRIFGSDRMKGMMETFKIPEDMPIESKMVSKSIASAQRKVEGDHFDMRKHVLEYDDVLNKHRQVVYRRRNEIVDIPPDRPESVREKVLETIEAELERVVRFHTASEDEAAWNMREIWEVAKTIVPLPADSLEKLKAIRHEAGDARADAQSRGDILTYLMEYAGRAYDELAADVDQALNRPGAYAEGVRVLMLRSIDSLWIDHLDAMEHLRTGIGLRSYGQRDPLIEYKKEAFRMFHELIQAIGQRVAYAVLKLGVQKRPQAAPSMIERQNVTYSAPSKGGEAKVSVRPADPKVGRNDPCPCGAKKQDGTPVKYKHCHGK
ncbi:preprotein translocase subunit SecA [Candidatus Uhrbacteria bacterium]|nr:preprotein translocase subunit SecA [Candidatus Uhrbacteria bacterium]